MNCNKRLLKEISGLLKQQHFNSDYLVELDEQDISIVHAIIKAPHDSVYRHRFIRLLFKIPDNYPFEPPIVTFVNISNKRIHPILYECGRVCLTILNTWPSDNERWSSSMTIESILLVIHSFLDNNPYTHEPGGQDNTTFTEYVQFQTWQTCLLDYLTDTNCPTLFIEFMSNYIQSNFIHIINDLTLLKWQFLEGYYETICFEIDLYYINYNSIIYKLNTLLPHLVPINNTPPPPPPPPDTQNNVCQICLESTTHTNTFITLICNHVFHKHCLECHLDTSDVCSICRQVVLVINPQTRRKIKVNGHTFNKLLNLGYTYDDFI